MNNRIRKISVMTALSSESVETKWATFVYEVGSERKLPIFGKEKPVYRTIGEILETEKHFILFISDNEITQEWKKISKSNRVDVEYFIQ
jgi:hypothetical protein